MKVVALISGGKDSTYNMMQCIAAGHKIVALANITPKTYKELDSYMYQSVGYEAIDYIAESMQLPLYKSLTAGKSNQIGKTYEPIDSNDEVEDLYNLLKLIKEEMDYDAVSIGAILSDYQRIRVENVCIRLGLVSLAYIWQRNQKELLQEMIKCEIDAIVIKVAALGLEPSRHLGRSLRLLEPQLDSMHENYGLNLCGEGGEYETLTLDCPLFKSRIVIDESEVVIHSDDAIAPVGYLKFNKLHLELKLPQLDLDDRLAHLPLKNSEGYITDDGEEAVELIMNSGNNVDNDIDECEEALSDIIINEDTQVEITINHSKSGDGWCCISNITGNSEDPHTSMTEAMDNLKCALESYGYKTQDVCSMNMFISNMDQYAELNKTYCDVFNHANPPTRACVEVPLPKRYSIILEAVAWSPPLTTGEITINRRTMHVQSISHWAPANIGPYSQAVEVGDYIHLAGQISLIPGSMVMVSGGIKKQCQLALRHVGRLLKAVDSNVTLRDVVQGVCYVTNLKHIDCVRKIWEEKTNNAIVDYLVVAGLPRNALVEWHVWAHKHNNQFEFEETGKCIDDWSICIFRRWNYENNIAAIVCHIDNLDGSIMNEAIFQETIDYVLYKLHQGHESDAMTLCALKIFYPINKMIPLEEIVRIMNDYQSTTNSLVYTIVPVLSLQSSHTYLSICGVRHQ